MPRVQEILSLSDVVPGGLFQTTGFVQILRYNSRGVGALPT